MPDQRGFQGRAADRDALDLIDVGELSFAIEYRHVGQEQGPSVHVFGPSDSGDSTVEEILRFDCFDKTPHYHYGFSYIDQPPVLIDRAAVGDPLAWVCSRIETRLPEMLTEAKAEHLASACDADALGAAACELLRRGRAF